MKYSNKILTLLFAALVSTAIFTSCNKEEDNEPTPGTVTIDFDYVFGSNAIPWELNKAYTHPKTGDELTFETFSFFISNVRLIDALGNKWEAPQDAYLICTSCSGDQSIVLSDVPGGDYVGFEYSMGVEGDLNNSGAQTGDLSPSTGMFWSWNTGYIMIKAEGTSPQSSDGSFSFHLGGFEGENNIVVAKQQVFSDGMLEVSADNNPTIMLQVNPAKLWHNAPSVAETSKTHMPGATATAMAVPLFDGVTFTGIK